MKKSVLLFDLDGTITDPKEGITKSIQYALKSFGIEVQDLDSLCPFIGPPLRQSFIDYYQMSEEQVEQAIEKYREYFSVTGLFENIPYDGIEAFLKRQQQKGRTLLLATSKPQVFAEQILVHFGLKEYFTVIGGSELDGRRDSKADVIEYVIKQAGLTDKSSMLMIGDRRFDIEGAKAHGIEAMGVLYGYGDLVEHQEAGADYIAKTIQDMELLLEIL